MTTNDRGKLALLVVHDDPQIVEAVRFGFERIGAVVRSTAIDLAPAVVLDAELIIAGTVGAQARDHIATLRRAITSCGDEVPLLWLGNGVSRGEALAAGATEVLPAPAFVRDVVTIGKLLASAAVNHRRAMGDLGEHFGVYYIMRALMAAERTGVLTLVRGLRRGELRFFEGEVTSAQVGPLHGLAALHQLLLWTEARLELRAEAVVRRRQIPLSPVETLRDAERFLADIRDVAGTVSPGAVYQQDAQQLTALARSIPTEVHGVIRLFDGHRTVADVVEDSPYRVFETLRIAQRLAEVDVIHRVGTTRSRPMSALAVEEWLVGGGNQGIPSVVTTRESEPVGPSPGQPASPPLRGDNVSKKKKGRGHGERDRDRRGTGEGHGVPERDPSSGVDPAVTSAVTSALLATDWSALVPSRSAEMMGMSPVVPSTVAAGEIRSRRPAEDLAYEQGRLRADEGAVELAAAPDDVSDASTQPMIVERDRLEELDAGQRASLFAVEPAPSQPGSRWDGDGSAIPEAVPLPSGPMAAALMAAKAAEAGFPADEDTVRLPRPAPAKPEPGSPDAVVTDGASQMDRAGEIRAVIPELPSVATSPAPGSSILVEDLGVQVIAVSDDAAAGAARALEAMADATSIPPVTEISDAATAPQVIAIAEAPTIPQAAVPAPVALAEAPAPAPPASAPPAVKAPVSSATPASQSAAAASQAAADVARDAAVAAARQAAFSAAEEAFFDAGAAPQPLPPADSFADLDDGYQPPTFWQRLFNRPPSATARKKTKKRP